MKTPGRGGNRGDFRKKVQAPNYLSGAYDKRGDMESWKAQDKGRGKSRKDETYANGMSGGHWRYKDSFFGTSLCILKIVYRFIIFMT